MTSATAACKAGTSSNPDNRIATGMLSTAEVVSNWLRNQYRCWAIDNGTCFGRCRATNGLRPPTPACSSTRAARECTDDASNNVRTGTAVSSAAPKWEAACIAISEFPPNSKKSSSRPTLSTPRTLANTLATISSIGVCGARYTFASSTGSGNALRSTLPLEFSGKPLRTTNADGTIYAGKDRPTNSDNSTVSIECPCTGTTYVASPVAPDGSSWPTVIEKSTLGCAAITVSISPSSIRKPRTFTWKSERPTYSRFIPEVHRTTSPVRYNREPASPKGFATNRSAVNPGRPR
ncbi:hypothetical protein MLGJGCBP_03138 [Rhodococcus sp. T7]|nr:hypothetical protein MLGJGCBP_03138 [Rhodococcus sp. T7]